MDRMRQRPTQPPPQRHQQPAPDFTTLLQTHTQTSARSSATTAATKYADYRAAFERYDIDGNGRLDEWEIKQVFKDVSIEPTQEELSAIHRAIEQSTNGDGLTLDEFVRIIDKDQLVAEESDERETLEAYVSLGGEPDKSGCVDADRIKQVITQFGLTINIDELLALLDADGSGQIEYDEFKCLFEQDDDEDELDQSSVVNPLTATARILNLDSSDDEADDAATPIDTETTNEFNLTSNTNTSNPSSVHLQPHPPSTPNQSPAVHRQR